jgi:hypothetical protein
MKLHLISSPNISRALLHRVVRMHARRLRIDLLERLAATPDPLTSDADRLLGDIVRALFLAETIASGPIASEVLHERYSRVSTVTSSPRHLRGGHSTIRAERRYSHQAHYACTRH